MADETDKQIANKINEYIRQARQATDKEGVDLINIAFSMIQKDRQIQCLNDEIHSSAEHYLFGRYASAYLPSSLVKASSLGYDALKFAVPHFVKDAIMRFSECKPSERTLKQTKWKILGCDDGSVDAIMRKRFIQPVSADYAEAKVIAALIFPGA